MTSFFEGLQQEIVRNEYKIAANGYLYTLPASNKQVLIVVFSGMSLSLKVASE